MPDGEPPNVIGIWSRPLNVFKSSPIAYFTPEETPPTEDNNILEEGSADTVFIRYFKDMLDYLTIIRKMSELYTDTATIKAHQNIWDGMKEVQIIS
jgi:hypothetical protein